MIFTFSYYIFVVSAVFFYGIGLNDSTIVCDSIHKLALTLIKMTLTIISTTLACFLIQKHFLIPLRLIDFIPLIALVIYVIFNLLIESVIRLSINKNTAEFNIGYLIVLLALYESSTIIDSIAISIGSFLSFAIILPILYSIKKRIELVGNMELHGNKRSLILISLAILASLLAVCNVSWLIPGVLQ